MGRWVGDFERKVTEPRKCHSSRRSAVALKGYGGTGFRASKSRCRFNGKRRLAGTACGSGILRRGGFCWGHIAAKPL